MGHGLRLFLTLVLAAAWGCFSPPSADVLFSCDPDDAPECPPDYTCQADGCCHRDGSDVDASPGACNSNDDAGPTTAGTGTASGAESGSTTGSGSGTGSSSGSGTGSSSGSGSSSSSGNSGTGGDRDTE